MRAIAMTDFDSGLALHDLPKPEAAADELLVRVLDSSINPIDVLAAAGALRGMMEYDFPVVPGRDFAGVVERVGSEVVGSRVGDAVLGFVTKPTLHDGAWAEYVTVPVDGFVVPKPEQLDFAAAAALPVAALTALAAVDAVDPHPGDVVLVIGAGGGVGSFAVQLAARRGATVIASAKPGDEQRLLDLGAAETVDYTGGDLVAAVRERHPDGVRSLIDLVNHGDAFMLAVALVQAGGRAASPLGAANADELAAREITGTNVMGSHPGPAGLARLAESAAAGELKVVIDSIRPLDEVPAAVEEFARGKRGKVVVSIA
ncbi:MAG TPA: NADP-dependent oxidoreductase [Gaiellaceae bacterium]|nr:NADP-dependent oxidoreductase [Gaiellaceae bacterium]